MCLRLLQAPGSVIKQVPQDVPHCLLAAQPNINISLGLSAQLHGASVVPGSQGSEAFASFVTHTLEAGKEYVLAVSIETTRTSNVPHEKSALATALQQTRGVDSDAVSAANKQWWDAWWAVGAEIKLGAKRQELEQFWYGQQYMLGSMSRSCKGKVSESGRCRDGETVPGLLGPWSMMNPVGWCDRLTLDYNVEANYFGAASSNHLDAMLPYFPTMTSMLESGKRRAKMSWSEPWSKHGYTNVSEYVSNGHPGLARWSTDMEHVNFGAGSVPHVPANMGNYKGAQMACAMGPWNNMAQWKDNAVRFDGALMAVPFVNYFEHTQDMAFLKDVAYV